MAMLRFQCDECDYETVIAVGDGGGPIAHEARVCDACQELVQVPARFTRGEPVEEVALNRCPACGRELPGTEVSIEDLAWEDLGQEDLAQEGPTRMRCPRKQCEGRLEEVLEGFWTARRGR